MAATDRPEFLPYDEFGLFHENAAEYGLPFDAPPAVERRDTTLPDGRVVSALGWGRGAPELVLLHGGAQNAHTWDTVAMALGVPLLAIDLPGHGHSGWRPEADYTPQANADDVAVAVAALAPDARAVVGMSLGGLTAICLAAQHPSLVRRLLLVDVTPGVTPAKSKAITDFIDGPQTFASFDELLARTIEHNPTRTESSLRRGILHNAHQLDDGSWQWRYDRRGGHLRRPAGPTDQPIFHADLWDAVSAVTCPLMLVRGSLSAVVDDDDVAEMRRRQPQMQYRMVDGAGHSIQGDRPLELAEIVREFVSGATA